MFENDERIMKHTRKNTYHNKHCDVLASVIICNELLMRVDIKYFYFALKPRFKQIWDLWVNAPWEDYELVIFFVAYVIGGEGGGFLIVFSSPEPKTHKVSL